MGYVYFPLWLAAWNAIIFWEVVVKSNQWGPLSHWTIKFIREMSVIGRWSEVTSILRQITVPMGTYTPFTFRGLVDFLLMAEAHVDSLGNTPLQRRNAVNRLVNTALIAPAAALHLLATIVERNQIEHHQMRILFAENPLVERYKCVAIMWIRWIDSFGAQYPRGLQATMLRIRELVDRKTDVEYSPTYILWDRLGLNESENSNEPMLDDPSEEGCSDYK